MAKRDVQPTGPAPSITGVSPDTGTILGGDSVIITGSKFTNTTEVDFGSVPAAEFTVNGDGSITATSPPQAAGTVDVRVTTQNTSAITAADQFTYKAPPASRTSARAAARPGST